MNSNLDIINKIKTVKSQSKMTNAELSTLSGVPLGTVNKILAHKTKSIKTETLNKLKVALNFEDESFNVSSVNSYGFVKVGAHTLKIKLACPDYNAKLMVDAICKASEVGVSLLVFPKLSLTGSTLGNLFYQKSLIKSCVDNLFKIINETKNLCVISVIGMPLFCGDKLYSVGAVIYKGELLGVVPDNSNDYKEFSSFYGIDSVCINAKKYPFGQILFKNQCDDFSFSVEFGSVYNVVTESGLNDALIKVCLSATPEIVNKEETVKTHLCAISNSNKLGYVFCDAGDGESTTDYVFSGKNYVFECGKIIKESKRFSTGLTVSDIDLDYVNLKRISNYSCGNVSDKVNKVTFNHIPCKFSLSRTFEKMPFVPKSATVLNNRAELILDIQAHALKRRIEHVNAKKLVIGISGGLDSTLALIVAVRALKLLNRTAEDVLAITMPCFGTTDRTKNNAYDLCEGLGVTLKEINIKNSVLQHFEDIGHDKDVVDVTFENSQARERTQVLMDLANKTGGLVIGTGDLSELALGFATYNGDHMSNYAVNASVPKTLIRYLVEYESGKSNTKLKNTLLDILATPVSPELVPPEKDGNIKQKTEDIIGPYILHDFYLYYAIKKCYGPSKIFYIAKKTFKNDFTKEVLLKWLKNFYNRFFAQQFKRSCMPDGVAVGSISFSPRGDFSMPSDVYKDVWLAEVESIKI